VKILFLSSTGQTGGAEVALLDLLAGLRALRPQWTLALVAASDGPLVERARAIGVTVRVLAFPARLARLGDWAVGRSVWARLRLALRAAPAAVSAWLYLQRLRRVMQQEAPDVVHTNGLKMHVLGAWARPARARVLWHLHDYAGRRPLAARLLRRCADRCAAVVANSRSVADDAARVCGTGVAVHPIWNAVDLARFAPQGSTADLDRLAGLPPAGPATIRIGLVATFARWKGHRTFLEALSLLPPTVDVRGYVIGGPVYETEGSQASLDELRDDAAARGLDGRVGFTGFITDPAAAMRALDIVVHASTEPEPFGLVIAEAMACGRAVVVSGAGGAAEIVTAGHDALTHAPGDARALATALDRLVNDAALRTRLGAAGRATAEQAFTRERLAREFAAVYQELAPAS
jgi:glycosyltransferase involved in cell wall biosynthesis